MSCTHVVSCTHVCPMYARVYPCMNTGGGLVCHVCDGICVCVCRERGGLVSLFLCRVCVCVCVCVQGQEEGWYHSSWECRPAFAAVSSTPLTFATAGSDRLCHVCVFVCIVCKYTQTHTHTHTHT